MTSKMHKKHGVTKRWLVSSILLVGFSFGSGIVAAQPADPEPVSTVDVAPTPPPMPAVVDAGVIVSTPTEVPSADGTTEDYEATGGVARIADTAMSIVVPVLTSTIGALLVLLLMWVRKKLKIQVADDTLMGWVDIAQRAVDRTAEWARNKVREELEGKKVPGPEKLEFAVNWAIDLGDMLGLPEMGRKKLAGLIEGYLAGDREKADA